MNPLSHRPTGNRRGGGRKHHLKEQEVPVPVIHGIGGKMRSSYPTTRIDTKHQTKANQPKDQAP